MNVDLKVEYYLLRIREKLNKETIKLWLPPYYLEDKLEQERINHEALENLAVKYSADLNIDKSICTTGLLELQKHALNKLRDEKIYKETGIAVIKVKYSDPITLNSVNNNNSGSKSLSIRIDLALFANDLKNQISEQTNVVPERIKLICRGRILNSTSPLHSQGLKNGCHVMAVVLSESSTELTDYEKRVDTLKRMKDDVDLLTNSVTPFNDDYFQIADQSGKTLTLPPEEKKALVTAMALHEKGRAALKKQDYSLALIFFLEADNEYSNCNSTLLDSVDNYGLLNLDIAWCYLCLQNVQQLPDAQKRLKICESKFKYSYGSNLERLVALKGSSGNEAALLMRLHLLQGIVLFHDNKHNEARKVLKEAQHELNSLKVDDNILHSLMELGISAAEGRIALRATNGCVNSAVEYVHRKRLEKEEILKKEKEEKEMKRLGLCKDGRQHVKPELVGQLESMGFSRSVSVEALRHANNEINEAITLIHQQPELLIPDENALNSHLADLINQIQSMGYDEEMANRALRNHNGDIFKAIEELTANNGIIQTVLAGASTSTMRSALEPTTKRLMKEKEAFDRFSEGVNSDIDDHLDLTLEEEEAFLVQYLSLLS